MTSLQHPADVLFDAEKPFPILPAVDHYAGAEKLMRKALSLQADLGPVFDVTFDCEDGAHAGAETEHAQMAAALAAGGDNRFGRVGARIHDITHPLWQQDLDILVRGAGHRLAFLTLPKARSAADVRIQIETLRRTESEYGIERPIPVHVLIETHGALPGSAMVSPGQFTHPVVVRAKSEIVAASLAYGVVPAHNVTTELHDAEAIRGDALRARREFGFLRMWSIHPNQILPIVDAMRPDFSEVRAAADILLAAQEVAWGPIQHDGKLHDRASYRYYWELLARANATGMSIDSTARKHFFA
jgi:citrate lyase subunit beta / citryl-CoA lyase